MHLSFDLVERLDFTLPDFTRFSWVSEEARRVWEPRLKRISSAWFDVEWLSGPRISLTQVPCASRNQGSQRSSGSW